MKFPKKMLKLYIPISSFLQNLYRTRLQTDLYLSQIQIVNNVHKETFSKYKNLYKGKDLAIIATGPSLAKYKPLENITNIAVNSAIKYDNIKFDYFFSIDYNGVKKVLPDIENHSQTKLFYGCLALHPYGFYEMCHDKVIIPESLILKHNASKFFVYSKQPVSPACFNVDIDSTWLADGGSSTFSAMQFALFTNPRRIYLVGCDCSSGYFDGKGGNDATPFIKVWKELKKFADTYYPDTEIISVNPVGLRGLFTDMDQE